MGRFGRDRVVEAGPGRGRRCRDRPHRDWVKGERPSVVCEPQRPIHSFFHHHMGGPDIVVDLIEVSVVSHGPIATQHPGRFDAEDAVEMSAGQTGPMQISGLRRLHGKALIVCGQIGLQEPVRR